MVTSGSFSTLRPENGFRSFLYGPKSPWHGVAALDCESAAAAMQQFADPLDRDVAS
jgi:hypothetical protein